MATSRKTSLASYSHQIASHARAIRIATANILPSTVVRQDVADAQEVTANVFPSPPSILSDIVALGLRPFAARTISMAYQRSALDFKARAEASHTLALQQLRQIPTGNASGPSKPNPLFTRAIITNYLKALEKWRQSIIGKVSQRIRELRDAHTPASEKKGFNVVRHSSALIGVSAHVVSPLFLYLKIFLHRMLVLRARRRSSWPFKLPWNTSK